MTEFVFPAGPNDYSLPAWENIFKAKTNGIFQVYDNKVVSGTNYSTQITRGAEVAVVKAFVKKDIQFSKLPYPDPDFYNIVLCLAPHFTQIYGEKEQKMGSESPHGSYFSNVKVKTKYAFQKNTELLWVVLRFTRNIAESFVREENDALDQLLKQQNSFIVYQYISEQMKELLERIKHVDQEPYPEVILRLKAGEVLTLFFTEFQESEISLRHKDIDPKDLETLFKIKERLVSDLKDRPTITALSKQFGMSPTKLKRLFKIVFGNSVLQYFQDYRLGIAKKLLASGQYRVSDVAYEIGYSNLSHFSDAFKKKFALLPNKYIERIRSQSKSQ